jgi:uncharacterized protein
VTSETAPAWLPKRAVAEVFTLWGLGFVGVALGMAVSPTAAKIVATLGFLYLPVWAMRRRDEDYPDYGLSADNLTRDIGQALLVSAIVFPLFVLGYVAFTKLLPFLPVEWVRLLTPYQSAELPAFAWRWPARFPEYVIDAIFVVALPEEFFYRGYVQTRLRDAWPEGKVWLGARFGKAFWVTAILFALGHLAILQVWRLAVFFPALLFGFMRERSGSVVGAALVHAASNLLIMVLDASFFGAR